MAISHPKSFHLSHFHYFCTMIAKLRYGFVVMALLLTGLFMQRCANMVAPTGGPKDTKPPVVVEAVPENHTVNFTNKKIEITFDEYVTLENANQNVLVSPPLSTKPDIKLTGKTVVVRFRETLKPNTTYTIDFGEAVKDLHEGNLFKDYTYSFSTGEVLDSLSIAGKLLSATDKKPVEKVFVSLYAATTAGYDSLPLLVPPDFITRTDKDGHFLFTGLPSQPYLVFAIKDANSNFFFDLPNEEVAFLDSLVWPVPVSDPKKKLVDSIAHPVTDTNSAVIHDSIRQVLCDTLSELAFDMQAKSLTMFMFAEEDTTQMLLEKKLVEEGLLRFVFRRPAQKVLVETPEILPDSLPLVKVHSRNFDTISWYFKPNVKDSLWVVVRQDTLVNDSTQYSLVFKEPKGNRGKDKVQRLKISNNIVNGCLLPEKGLTLTFSEPLLDFSLPDSVVFVAGQDTLQMPLVFEQSDAFGFQYRLKNTLEAETDYAICIPDSALYGVRGRTNEAFSLRFRLATEKDYGNIFVTVVPPENVPQVVVQLLDAKKNVVSEQVLSEKGELEFWYLTPGKYTLKAILDADCNGKWSTGNYHRHFLPETVVEYKNELDLKAGWDIDLDEAWVLTDN